MQRVYGLVRSGLQRLLLFVGLHKDVVMRGNHPDGGVVDGAPALLNAFFLALDDALAIFGQALLGFEIGQCCGVFAKPVSGPTSLSLRAQHT